MFTLKSQLISIFLAGVVRKVLVVLESRALKFAVVICTMIFCMLSGSIAHAEYFGAPTGRTATFSTQPQLSIEGALSNGEFLESDYTQVGVRLNYQFNPKLLMFGDLGQSELGTESEISFGIGAYYSLGQSILGSDDSAVKVSVHQVNFDKIPGSSGGVSPSVSCGPVPNPAAILNTDLPVTDFLCQPTFSATSGSPDRGGDIRNIAFELLISGALSDSIFGNDANWYANGGIQLLDGFREDDQVLGFGAGVVKSISESEVYAGFDFADDTYIGIGYRYFIK